MYPVDVVGQDGIYDARKAPVREVDREPMHMLPTATKAHKGLAMVKCGPLRIEKFVVKGLSTYFECFRIFTPNVFAFWRSLDAHEHLRPRGSRVDGLYECWRCDGTRAVTRHTWVV